MYTLLGIATLAIISLLEINTWLQVALFIAVSAGFIYLLAKEWGYLGNHGVVLIVWGETNHWLLTTASGQQLEARLLPDSVSLPYLMVLNFKIPGQYIIRSIVLYQDSFGDVDSFRKLRVRLRVQSSVIVADED